MQVFVRRFLHETGCLFSSLPAEQSIFIFWFDGRLRATSDTPTEEPTTGQLRDRQLAMVITCLRAVGPCALQSCSRKNCLVLDGFAAAAQKNMSLRRVPAFPEIYQGFQYYYKHKPVTVFSDRVMRIRLTLPPLRVPFAFCCGSSCRPC